MPTIDSERLRQIIEACLFEQAEIDAVAPNKPAHVKVEGLTRIVAFHPGRLAEHRAEIERYLALLPDAFHDGWTFLNMCTDRHGVQWTDFHTAMEDLVVLGMAIGKVSYCAPRSTWSVLPGGVPYVKVEAAGLTGG